MPDLQIYRGDAYALRRPLFTHFLTNQDGSPFNLTSCTVRTTFKIAPTDPNDDTTDETAVIKGTLVVDGTGTATLQDKLNLLGAATAGTVVLRLTAEETLALPIGEQWMSDVELIDANGEAFTFVFTDKISAIDAYTNRTTD